MSTLVTEFRHTTVYLMDLEVLAILDPKGESGYKHAYEEAVKIRVHAVKEMVCTTPKHGRYRWFRT